MEVKLLAINSIRPDPNQPRKGFDLEKVKDMAASMKTEGVIKPIEIDRESIIITGELRWRAAKLAGLKTIPCLVRDATGRERFRRQLIENIHNNTMSAIDTANALRELIREYGDINDASILKLSKEIGAQRNFVKEHLDALNLTDGLKKKLEEGKLPRTIVRAIKIVPEELRKKFEKKLVSEDISRDAAVGLSRSLHFHPEMADQLLKKKYSTMTPQETAKFLGDVAPSASEHLEKANDVEQGLHRHILAIQRWFMENDLEDLPKAHQALVKHDLRLLGDLVSKWAKRQGLSTPGNKQLTGKE